MNISNPYISICIPAYKRPENIDRLLQSVSSQTYKNYEVIISDDSPDDSLKVVLQKYSHLPILYYKNERALGTPANWNYAISKAKGEWIKLIHDDDWFAVTTSLERFAKETGIGKKFIFSAYANVYGPGQKEQKMFFPAGWRKRILDNPVTLLPRNVIGPPSVTLVHKSLTQRYDTNMKWRVDIDYYIRILKEQEDFAYIDQPLMNVGIGTTQVTNYCINNPEVELPEGLLLLQKYNVPALKNILVYDSWWRIIRNVNVRSRKQLEQYTPYNQWPPAILKMAEHQSYIPKFLLSIGFASKLLMSLSYILNYRYLNSYN